MKDTELMREIVCRYQLQYDEGWEGANSKSKTLPTEYKSQSEAFQAATRMLFTKRNKQKLEENGMSYETLVNDYQASLICSSTRFHTRYIMTMSLVPKFAYL